MVSRQLGRELFLLVWWKPWCKVFVKSMKLSSPWHNGPFGNETVQPGLKGLHGVIPSCHSQPPYEPHEGDVTGAVVLRVPTGMRKQGSRCTSEQD